MGREQRKKDQKGAAEARNEEKAALVDKWEFYLL